MIRDRGGKPPKVPPGGVTGALLLILILAAATRIPWWSRLLLDHDCAAFSLAVRDFNLAAWRPHPPGSPVWVMLGRLMTVFTGDPRISFLLINLVLSVLIGIMAFRLASERNSSSDSLALAALLVISPTLWFFSVTARSYLFDTLGVLLLILLMRGAWDRRDPSPLLPAGILLGLMGGARQSLLLFATPLFIVAIIRSRKNGPVRCVTALAALGASVAVWAGPMINDTGGIGRYLDILSIYSNTAVARFGISRVHLAAAYLAFQAFRGLGGLLLFCRIPRRLPEGEVSFLAWGVLPALLFFLIEHNGDGYFLYLLPFIFRVISLSVPANLPSRGALFVPAAGVSILMAVLGGGIGITALHDRIYPFNPMITGLDEIREKNARLEDTIEFLGGLPEDSSPIVFTSHSNPYEGAKQLQYYLPDLAPWITDFGPVQMEGYHRSGEYNPEGRGLLVVLDDDLFAFARDGDRYETVVLESGKTVHMTDIRAGESLRFSFHSFRLIPGGGDTIAE